MAPQVVVIEPGHDAWVDGDEMAVMIQFDAEAETASRFGVGIPSITESVMVLLYSLFQLYLRGLLR